MHYQGVTLAIARCIELALQLSDVGAAGSPPSPQVRDARLERVVDEAAVLVQCLEYGGRAKSQGCVIAAAGSEVPRQQAEVRRAANRRIKDLIGLIERQFPEWGRRAAHDKSMGIAATLVGALVLARAVDDAQLSSRVRKAARELVRAAVG